MEILVLSEADVQSLFSVKEAIPLVEHAFLELARGAAQMPPKVYLSFPEFQGDLRAMPAYMPSTGAGSGKPYAAVKVVNSHGRNPERGLPAVAATLVLNDPETGLPLAFLGAGRLTDRRTGAAGAVAARCLARPESAVVGLVGCGRQAMTQLEGLRNVFQIKKVLAAGRTFEEARQFCSGLKGEDLEVVPCEDVRRACAADILVTTTPSRSPVVRAEWVRPGTHINAIGADAPGKQELETALLRSARVVVDWPEQAFHSGEVNVPFAAGALKKEQVVGHLGEILLGVKKGRTSPSDITVFDSTGLAVQDLAAASWVYEKALAEKKGRKIVI